MDNQSYEDMQADLQEKLKQQARMQALQKLQNMQQMPEATPQPARTPEEAANSDNTPPAPSLAGMLPSFGSSKPAAPQLAPKNEEAEAIKNALKGKRQTDYINDLFKNQE